MKWTVALAGTLASFGFGAVARLARLGKGGTALAGAWLVGLFGSQDWGILRRRLGFSIGFAEVRDGPGVLPPSRRHVAKNRRSARAVPTRAPP